VLTPSIPLAQRDTVKAIHFASIKVRHRIRFTAGATAQCPWCAIGKTPTDPSVANETIEHRFYDCPLTKTIWEWIGKFVFPPTCDLPYHPYERITGDIQTVKAKHPAAHIWHILHASVCHNIFKITRAQALATTSKLKTITTIKARIITDLADAIRAEWHTATASTQQQLQHRQIVKFASIWCSTTGYPRRVKLMCGGDEYSLSDSSLNIHTPTLLIDLTNLTPRPTRTGDTFLAQLQARNFTRRGLVQPQGQQRPTDGNARPDG
jgi:hypothetical protein